MVPILTTICHSILKYETSVDGFKRKLIVKNIRQSDSGSYYCKALGANSSVSCTLAVTGGSSSSSFIGATASSAGNYSI